MKIRIADDNQGAIAIMIGDSTIRGWSYANDEERRRKLHMAREYVEGWYDGQDCGRDEGFSDGWDAALNDMARR